MEVKKLFAEGEREKVFFLLFWSFGLVISTTYRKQF